MVPGNRNPPSYAASLVCLSVKRRVVPPEMIKTRNNGVALGDMQTTRRAATDGFCPRFPVLRSVRQAISAERNGLPRASQPISDERNGLPGASQAILDERNGLPRASQPIFWREKAISVRIGRFSPPDPLS